MEALETLYSSLGWTPLPVLSQVILVIGCRDPHVQPEGCPPAPLRCPGLRAHTAQQGREADLFSFRTQPGRDALFLEATHSPASLCYWGACRLRGGQASSLVPGKQGSEFPGGRPS